MNKILITVFTLFLINHLNAQGAANKNLPNILPPSPSAYSFLKYGEIPVSTYTGVPNISIPLYTIKARGIEIPIDLSYHSNGFKVNEESSWTGLGWTINAGGSIVQLVNGYDDFGKYKNRTPIDITEIGRVATSNNIPNGALDPCNGDVTSRFISLNERNFSALTNFDRACADGNNYYSSILFSKFVNNSLDFKPDIFKFNVLGYSGEFIIDWSTGEFVCLTDKKIKIRNPNYVPGQDFIPNQLEIAVPDGHKFIFELKEETSFTQNFPSAAEASLIGEKSSRTFKLVKIYTKKNDEINFSYGLGQTSFSFANYSGNHVVYEHFPTSTFPSKLIAIQPSFSIFETSQSTSYLKSISFTNGFISFNCSNRIDLVGAKKLDKINIHQYGENAPAIKEIEFSYDYFVGHNNSTDIDDTYLTNITKVNSQKTAKEATYRLKLNSVKEGGKNPYLFEYNNEILPSKISLASDYWGYYNGFLTNETLFSNIYRFNIEIDKEKYLSNRNNNKSPNGKFTKAAVLEKITYPTKGYTVFDYELNKFKNDYVPNFDDSNANPSQGNQIRIQIDTNPSTAPISIQAAIFESKNTLLEGSSLLSIRGCSEIGITQASANTYIKIEYYDDALLNEVQNSSYGYLYALHNKDAFIVHTDYIQMRTNDPIELLNNNLSYSLYKKGVVRFSAVGGCGSYNGTTNSSGVSLTIKGFDVSISQPSFEYTGCGLRVKTIDTYDHTKTKTNSKKYQYRDGRLNIPLSFFNYGFISSYSGMENVTPQSPYGSNESRGRGYRKTLSTSNYNVASINGGGDYVGYSEVDEILLSTTDELVANGKITEVYYNKPLIGGFGNSMQKNPSINGIYRELQMPLLENGIKNGLLKEKLIYNKKNLLVSKTVNTYINTRVKCFSAYVLGGIYKNTLCRPQAPYVVYNDERLLGIYPISKINSYLKTSHKTNYYSNNTNISTKESYIYNNLQLVSKSQLTKSDGNQIETNYYYKDFPIHSEQTYSNNIIKKEVFENNNLNYIEKHNYSTIWDSLYPNVILKLNSYWLGKSSEENLEEIITYHAYDNKGNPLEVSKKDGTKIYYVWGYQQSQPIAKITGYTDAALASAQSLITAAIAASNNDNDRKIDIVNINGSITKVGKEGDLREALRNLRENPNMLNAQVTSFTYDPLIGVTSTTDPRGQTVYYQYDAFNRLESVKDSEGNMVSKNEYNYKN